MAATAGIDRRAFLRGGKCAPRYVPRPPGTTAASLSACTACRGCAEACPTHIIDFRDGLPFLDFHRGECIFCGQCAAACPHAVFPDAPRNSFPHVIAIGDACLARRGVTCMTCRDACPEAAIAFAPRVGGPFLPHLTEEDCTGCGACIAACPAESIATIAHGGQG